jgi:hypothetical protein
MLKHMAALLLLAGLACPPLSGCGGSEQAASTPGLGDKGARFVTLLAEGKFDEAATWLDPAMSAAMPSAKLEDTWGSLSRMGTYRGQAGTRTATERGFEVVYVTCSFETGSVDVKVVFDQQGKVAGLWFVDPTPA